MLNLNGKDLPDFVKINNIEFSVLPPVENSFLKVRGKDGAYLYSQDVGTRIFTVYFSIIAEEVNGVMATTREFAEWLHHKEPVKLIIDDEPDKYYLVVPEGETNITETVNVGQGEFTLVCTEPYAFGETIEETYELTGEDDIAELDVAGTVDTHPEIELTVKEDITSISVNTVDEENSILIGEPITIDETPQQTEPPLVQIEEMEDKDITEWERAYTVDGGTIVGEMVTNGTSFRQKDKNYGSGDKWHGASMIRTLDKPIDDFRIHFGITFKNDVAKKQVGRVELYLLDEDNVQFGKIALVDRYSNASRNVFEARAGTWGEGHYFARSSHIDIWNNAYGSLKIIRHGRQWTASLSPKNNGRYDIKYEQTWFDSEERWTNKLAKIQVHFGANGNSQPVADMAISHITVRERLTLEESHVPIIATKNDKILIDNSKMLVYLNGEPRFDLINPASNFIKLKQGVNQLQVTPANVDMTVSYPERWL